MNHAPQPPEERLEAALRDAHRRARRVDAAIRDFTNYLYENPTKVAQDLLFLVPRWMDTWRAIAISRFGYDMENRKKREDFAVDNFQDALELVQLMNHYYTSDLVMERWAAVKNEGLVDEQLARAICDAFIEAYKERPGLAAMGIELLEAGLPNGSRGLVLSAYLTSYLATHTSLHANPRLRHSIDELREEEESRFARLLKELPAEALAAYRDRPRGFGNLMDIRTEAVRRLEKREAPPNLQDLADFADRENLLNYAKAIRLSPQELEVFIVCTERPNLKYREVAALLGISTSQVGVIKHRIKQKRAAGF
jgi:hypothetical protein